MALFRRKQEAATAAPFVPTIESQLEALDAEEQRWEGLIEGTTGAEISTEVIMGGMRSVTERREELLSQLPSSQQ